MTCDLMRPATLLFKILTVNKHRSVLLRLLGKKKIVPRFQLMEFIGSNFTCNQSNCLKYCNDKKLLMWLIIHCTKLFSFARIYVIVQSLYNTLHYNRDLDNMVMMCSHFFYHGFYKGIIGK